MTAEEGGWTARLRAALGKTSSRLASGVASAFARARVDAAALDELEDALITADLGAAAAARLRAALEKHTFAETPSPEEAVRALAGEIAAILAPVAHDLEIDPAKKPFVVLVCGVNGTGKTTTIGKLAARAKAAGHTVMLAAGDTFRAAAIEQLQVWGERAGAEVITAEAGSDAAALAFRAHESARAKGADVLFVDTAGRLQNKSGLMDELKKIVRVLGKQDSSAPHAALLVLDGTTGQNTLSQVETFKEAVDVTGLIVTKLDGTAKGGAVVALAERFGLPVHAVGVGEGVDDLRPFDAQMFADSLLDVKQGDRS
ncbi:MAG: signal recognition particle-docking protein FtsY [Rhodospirillales bacterium]